MATAADLLSFPALPPAAPELGDYTQFTACDIPPKSGATRAFKGYIRPFDSDANAREVLRAIDSNGTVRISRGRLSAESESLKKHRLEDYLIGMAVPCTILLLEFPGSEHPRAFLLDPQMVPGLSECHHLRRDRAIEIDGREFPALCVYSGNLVTRGSLEQFLDQTAAYIARYLIWLRTRKLYRRTSHGAELVLNRAPGDPVFPLGPREKVQFWHGHWPGREAPSGPRAHLTTIKPAHECWCWSGDKYGHCCRPNDLAAIARAYVPLLMKAVYRKSRQ